MDGITLLEKEVEDIKERVEKLDEKIEKYQNETKKKQHELETNFMIIRLTVDNTNVLVTEIKEDIKEMRKQRENDHYIKPVKRWDGIMHQILNVLITIFVMAFVYFLFPQIHK